MICPLCTEDLTNSQLALVCLAHGRIDAARIIPGSTEHVLANAMKCEKEGGKHQYWLRHIGCSITHPYWTELDLFSNTPDCIPASAGKVNHPDFEIYLRAYSLLQHRLDPETQKTAMVVFDQNLVFLLLLKVVRNCAASGRGTIDLKSDLVAMLGHYRAVNAVELVEYWYKGLADDGHETLISRITERLRISEAWFPDWMLLGDAPLGISMHGKTSVGKTVFSLQAMHGGGYGSLEQVGLQNTFLFTPPSGESELESARWSYSSTDDDNIKQHTVLQMLIGGDAAPTPPPTKFRRGNIKAFDLTLRVDHQSAGTPISATSDPQGWKQQVYQMPRLFWETLVKSHPLVRPSRRRIVIYDAPGEAVNDANKYLLTELLGKVQVATLMVEAKDLFIVPSGRNNTIDGVNDQLKWIIQHNQAEDTSHVRVALVINKLDNLAHWLQKRREHTESLCPAREKKTESAEKRDDAAWGDAVDANGTLPDFGMWYIQAKTDGRIQIPGIPLGSSTSITEDVLALGATRDGHLVEPSLAMLVFEAWTKERQVAGIHEIDTLLQRLNTLRLSLENPKMDFKVFLTWTDLNVRLQGGQAPRSHGLSEFLVWALKCTPESLGILK